MIEVFTGGLIEFKAHVADVIRQQAIGCTQREDERLMRLAAKVEAITVAPNAFVNNFNSRSIWHNYIELFGLMVASGFESADTDPEDNNYMLIRGSVLVYFNQTDDKPLHLALESVGDELCMIASDAAVIGEPALLAQMRAWLALPSVQAAMAYGSDE